MTPPTSTWWPWRDRWVHIARAVVPGADVRVMVIHGGGVLGPDLPLYGDTVDRDPSRVRYDDSVDLLCDLVRAECADDDRPLILFGASMGGMLAYEVAARTG